jgi:hypothetical protein
VRRALAAVSALVLTAACATVPMNEGLPRIHYAQAASKGGVYAVVTPRPSEADLRRADNLWRKGLGDAIACGVPRTEVARIAVAAAAELATMSAVVKDGDGRVDDALLRSLARSLLSQMLSPPPRPPRARCRAIERWSEEVRDDGQEAIGRAIAKGLLPLL